MQQPEAIYLRAREIDERAQRLIVRCNTNTGQATIEKGSKLAVGNEGDVDSAH